ncbi:MAG: hypothetical protein NUV93_08225 [Firmicutes bacterium]|jgi:hypothetical protein|nr:hypothetical protein [Bacillota bacterium]
MPASDVRSRSVPVLLDRERRLRYDFNALAALEERFGNLDSAFEALGQKGTVKGLRALLWAGLIHEDPALTEEQVGAMVTLADLPRIMQAVNEAFKEAMPVVDPPKPPPGTEAGK